MNLKSIKDIPQSWKFVKCRHKPTYPVAYEAAEECDIETSEGTMKADKGDIILEDVKCGIYPCKREVFFEIYELI